MTEGIAPSDAAPEISNGSVVGAVIAFNTLTLIGAFMVVLVISVPMFSSNIHRSKLWFSQMVSWLVYSFSYMLLFGRQLKPEEPPFGICMFQAALIYASPPLVALSAMCFVIDVKSSTYYCVSIVHISSVLPTTGGQVKWKEMESHMGIHFARSTIPCLCDRLLRDHISRPFHHPAGSHELPVLSFEPWNPVRLPFVLSVRQYRIF